MPDTEKLQQELEEINKELATLKEGSRAYQALMKDKVALEATLTGSGAVAQGDGAQAVGERGFGARDVNGSVVATGDHNTIIVNLVTLEKKSLPHPEALKRYLENLIATHQSLRLQGIRTGNNQPLSVSLERVYVSLTALDKRATGMSQSRGIEDVMMRSDAGRLRIGAALQRYRRLVIIGDPGSGKTTLLSFLALTYARTLSNENDLVKERLGLTEPKHLPILLPLRDLGRHLQEEHPNPGKDGPVLLLDYLRGYFAAQAINLPENFFLTYLENGQATVLLDGMDEVADSALRQRVARLVEKFALRFGEARFVVTSREVGYGGPARIGADFGLARVQEFSNEDVRRFVRDWTRVVEVTLAGAETPDILRMADENANKLIAAIENNPRVAELAVNPLLLTVIALVHRYRAELPERRSELYEESVEVLLWHWDKAKGLDEEQEIMGVRLDSGDRRSLLEPVAFWMHERQRREIEKPELKDLLLPRFRNLAGNETRADKAVDAFLAVVNERSGLLIERGAGGVYGFAHLTFQEYLAARALAGRKDSIEYSLKVLPDSWWRETLLLEAGYLGGQGPSRVSELIATIMNADPGTEPEPHHHLLLAAECLFDVGPARVEGDLLGEAKRRLQKQADAPITRGDKQLVLGKVHAMNALARIESGQFTSQFWRLPWGEPEWVTIPEGEFWMGGEGQYDGKPLHKVYLPEYQIAKVPVTNAQYAIYVKDAGVAPPSNWRGGNVPQGLENHPVVNVAWLDAMACCRWLGEKIKKPVTLPSEAEWEKAARGGLPSPDRRGGGGEVRDYPWGAWQELRCNGGYLDLKETTPVGLFLNGASPYGVLDLCGNVWEWTRSLYREYPYKADDGREDLSLRGDRVLRGGAYGDFGDRLRCAFRLRYHPYDWYNHLGFRVMVSCGA